MALKTAPNLSLIHSMCQQKFSYSHKHTEKKIATKKNLIIIPPIAMHLAELDDNSSSGGDDNTKAEPNKFMK